MRDKFEKGTLMEKEHKCSGCSWCHAGKDKGKMWRYSGKGTSVKLSLPVDWVREGWRYVQGEKWDRKELRKKISKNNYQYRVVR